MPLPSATAFTVMATACSSYNASPSGLCTKNTSRALIERPYSCAPQAVGAVYDRPGFFVQSPVECVKVAAQQPPLLDSKIVCCAGIAATVQQIHFPRGQGFVVRERG